MRTEQIKKQMQTKESVEMTVEDLTVIMSLIDQGAKYYDNVFYQYDKVTMDTGHTKTQFKLDRDQLYQIMAKFERQFMDAVLDNVEGVVF